MLTPDQKKAAVAALPAPFNTGDPAKGEQKFAICRSCHTVAQGGPNLTGPNLAGIFGRKAGTHPDFNYSDVVKAAGFTFCGPTIVYAFMQATGMVNDHMIGCPCHGRVAAMAG